MDARQRISCYVIGGDTLLIECVDVLIERGHDVRGVITDSERIAEAARGRDIPTLSASGDYAAELSGAPFDYLFSITHLALIPNRVLQLPAKGSVNFHDGPLPRYAGLNAPVWALMLGEEEYGVTWHLMTEEIDEGDILRRVSFEISPRETALSLNTKCMAAALESFPGLVEDLASGGVKPTPQNPEHRSYFGKHDRPAAACMIDWGKPAATIDALVRALSFGPYPNPVGLPHSSLATPVRRPFIVDETRIGAMRSPPGSHPGDILEVGERAVSVATGDQGVIELLALRTIDGSPVAPDEVSTVLGIRPGERLLDPQSDVGRRLSELAPDLSRAESSWVARLMAADSAEVALADPAAGVPRWNRMTIDVPGGECAEPSSVISAFAVYLGRTGRKERFHLSLSDVVVTDRLGPAAPWFADRVPLEVDLAGCASFEDVVTSIDADVDRTRSLVRHLRDLRLRTPELTGPGSGRSLAAGVAIVDDARGQAPSSPVAEVCYLAVSRDGGDAVLHFDETRLDPEAARSIARSIGTYLEEVSEDRPRHWAHAALVDRDGLNRQLEEWNQTGVDLAGDWCVHQLFEQQVDRTPDRVAVRWGDESLTYRELDERTNQLARRLLEHGVGPGSFVGVHVRPSPELVVSTLAVMKAGGAYVPLDPEFPRDRLAFMVEDSRAGVVVSDSPDDSLFSSGEIAVIRPSDERTPTDERGSDRPAVGVGAGDLAYAIYTSGSTGTPKGVLIEHRNVANFFEGMDAVVPHDPPGVWLAVTSLSFDISVLELFWTLTRGFEVVLFRDPNRMDESSDLSSRHPERSLDFGLFMWGNDDGPGPEKYRLLLEGARYFDQNGFSSVWTPERHFHSFGGPFPNPSVTGAALAVSTERIAIRSGSCVSPLHHPIRIAEEWAVVDNLSNGRVGLSFAAGWQPNDFVIRPEAFADNKALMLEQIDVVRRLWRGEPVEFENPMGQPFAARTLPRPVQDELPFWVTTAGNPDTYRRAGEMGANVLTHLLGQSLDEVAEKIEIYRTAREEAGLDPNEGVVTLMLHTFVGASDEAVREIVREPMKSYLAASMRLVLGYAWSFPAFKRPGGADAQVEDVDLSELSDEETDAILDFAFERYFETSGLFGTPQTALAMADRCKAIGVDEIACLLDFGVDTDLVLDSLPALKLVREAANAGSGDAEEAAKPESFAEQVCGNRVTHLQCTPSMARLLMEDPEDRAALAGIPNIFLGGEALPPALARGLLDAGAPRITNMYGPTETTIWSTTHPVEEVEGSISIGRPIANTRIYVLDQHAQPLPVGVPGDLFIGGLGVARGYHERPALTEERFVADPFVGGGARMYRTGDLARWRPDGRLDFLGRTDHQVKLRGYRIELGEIEARLGDHPDVASAVVLVDATPGADRLIAYVASGGRAIDGARIRGFLRETLPDYMVPAVFVPVRSMPLTPNGKIDRLALARMEAPGSVSDGESPPVERPATTLESTIADAWCSVLGIERVGVSENFFDIGGHSLLVVQLHRRLREETGREISLVDLYRFPTVRALAEHLGRDTSAPDLEGPVDRAERRRRAMTGRSRRQNR